jgi:predicted Holliday junction resolvase-like endonuclease
MIIFLVVLILILLFTLGICWFNIRRLNLLVVLKDESYSKLLSQKKSSEVRLGQISEHLVPFLKEFKYDPKKAHFLGMPIDYIVFDDDQIVFLEVKTGESQLSSTQRSIRNLVKDKKVSWEIIRIN